MITFGELFREGQKINPLDNGAFARLNAQEALSGSGITFRSSEVPELPRNGAIIGIAFYSLADLSLIDELVIARRDKNLSHSGSESVVLFDVLTCKSMGDFEQLIPGIGPVYHTPVVGIWKEGQLVETGTGAKGRMLLSRLYNLKEGRP
jgi:hypothetical protein